MGPSSLSMYIVSVRDSIGRAGPETSYTSCPRAASSVWSEVSTSVTESAADSHGYRRKLTAGRQPTETYGYQASARVRCFLQNKSRLFRGGYSYNVLELVLRNASQDCVGRAPRSVDVRVARQLRYQPT